MSDNGLVMQVPHSIDLEEQLIGSLIYLGEQFPMVRGVVTPSDFYIVRYGWAFAAMQRIDARGQQIDYVTVADELRAAGKMEEFGGAGELTRLVNYMYGRGGAADYAQRIAALATRRRGLIALSDCAKLLHDESTDINATADMVMAALSKALMSSNSAQLMTVSDAVQANFDTIETKRRENVTGLATGFLDLDDLLGGLQKGDLVIVAGRPGMGKTSFLLSLALHMMETKTAVPAIFSLEMSNEQISQRFTAMDKNASVTVKAQRTPAKMSDDEWQMFTDATVRATKHTGVLDDTGGITPEQLRGKAQVAVTKHGASVIMVDYLQLMKAPQYMSQRTQEVGYITHELKNLAKELRVPVIAAAQLNRDVEKRQEKRPQMADLRESGDIENDADVIMFLYRDEYYNENSEFKNQVEAIVSKHRHGPTGKVALFFDAPKMRVFNLARKAVDLGTLDGPSAPSRKRPKVAPVPAHVYRGGER